MLIVAGNAWGISIQADIDNDGVSPGDALLFQYFESRFPAGLEGELLGGAGFDGDQNFDWSAAWFDRITDRFEQRPGRRGGRAGGRIGQALWLEMMRQECDIDCQLTQWLASKQDSWAVWNNHESSALAEENLPVNPSPVPLPASVLFFVSGLIGLTGFLRRSRKVAVHT